MADICQLNGGGRPRGRPRSTAARTPHPAAARLFANWLLTREGQTVLTSSLPANSARTDVPPHQSEGVAAPGVAYYEPDREANYPHTADTQRLVRSLLRTTN